MDENEFLLRFKATDWDKETAKAVNDYLSTVESDADGECAAAYVDEPITGWLGVHVFPLDKYPATRRHEIAEACARIRSAVSDEVTAADTRPFDPFPKGEGKREKR